MPPCNVLIVENEEDLREEVAEFLEENDYAVHSAADGVEALEFLKALPVDELPDLVLLDLWMPRMNGRELRAELKKTPELSQIPVVAFTADRASEDVLSIGADDYIAKPPDLDALLATVEYFCRRRRGGSASVSG